MVASKGFARACAVGHAGLPGYVSIPLCLLRLGVVLDRALSSTIAGAKAISGAIHYRYALRVKSMLLKARPKGELSK
jgi:hypothetical protein